MKTQITTKYFFFGTFSVVFLGLLVFSGGIKKTFAALPTLPVPSYGVINISDLETSVKISDDLISKWKGSFQLNEQSVILREKKLSAVVKNVVGVEVVGDQKNVTYNPSAIYNWTKDISASINSKASDPEIIIINGRVTKFTPPDLGRSVDRFNTTLKIINSLEANKKNVLMDVKTTQPKKNLAELNNLGITELIGRGESKFGGSPSNRMHNIKIGVQKMQGLIIKPGEEFSFNKYLGPVEAYAGFLPELVIKKSGTVPELGGGLCQVSSTVFRAIMNAGLPVEQRRNHSYAVQYYAPQGTDATIYPGVIDLKFTNDTGKSILIWPFFKDPTHLIFEFYGTSDKREVILGQPYVYDKKSDGSMKATWKRTVIKDGKKTEDVFNSTYQPPALFHKQETFVNTSGEQKTTPQTAPPTITPTTPTGEVPTTPQTAPNSEPPKTIEPTPETI